MLNHRVRACLVLVTVLGLVSAGCDDGVTSGSAAADQPATAPANADTPQNPLARDSAPQNPLARPADSGAAPSNPLARTDQPPRPAESATASAPFHGTWNTTYQGSQSILRLEQSGNKVTGTIDLAIINGTADGNTARGDVTNPEDRRNVGTFTLTRKGEDIELQLTLRDPDTGQTLALPAFAYKPGEPKQPDATLDPVVVGRWRNTETYTSGDFTAATDTWLILNADGTYEYGHGKTGAGGAAGSVISGRGDAETGKWRTQDRHLQYQEDGAGPWQTFGRYYVEGDTLMITFPNGKRQLWYRR